MGGVKGRTLGDYPDILSQWHSELNGTITRYGKPVKPENLASQSGVKIWWHCPESTEHVWQTSVCTRVNAVNSCPFCSNSRVCSTNSLQTMNPKMALEWHPKKNGSLTPNEILNYSGKKVWWKCPVAEDHEWKQSPSVRNSQSTGCPSCQNLQLSVTNSFVINYPEMAKEWHPTKNGNLQADNLISGSATKVWWKCDIAGDHVWRTSLDKRISGGQGCPCCAYPIRKVVPSNSLAEKFPKLVDEWDFQKNMKGPTEYASGSSKKVNWICQEGHTFSQMVSNRTLHGQGCPRCNSDRDFLLPDKSNSLGKKYPELILEWNEELNAPLTPWEVLPGTHQKFHWKCREEFCRHEWVVSATSRIWWKSGCPNCAKYGFNAEEPATLYCLAIVGPGGIWWYKVGISCDHLRRAKQIQSSLRRNKLDLDVEILDAINFDFGADAMNIEAKLKATKSIRIETKEIFDGSTELFSENPIEFARNHGLIER
jgi:hypothetical protein